MKDFFIQAMKDLYALTGIEQVRWMQADLTNGKRDFDTCVNAMVATSKQFPYIKEDDQKKIISRMMIEDKTYKGLNSRQIWIWLDMNKDAYYRGQTHFKEESKLTYPEYLKVCLRDNLTPLSEQEFDKPISSERVAEYMSDLAANMGVEKAPEREDGIKDPLVALMKDQMASGIRPEEKKLRAQYVQENYEIDGTKKPGWSTFEEWSAVVDALKRINKQETLTRGTSE